MKQMIWIRKDNQPHWLKVQHKSELINQLLAQHWNSQPEEFIEYTDEPVVSDEVCTGHTFKGWCGKKGCRHDPR